MKETTPTAVHAWFEKALEDAWPVALGSLSLRRSPCTRSGCSACASGAQHQSYVLYGLRRGRRFALYVPAEMVPEVRKALANGRRLQELVFDAGFRWVKARKAERRGSTP
jgi:hypothetical protein